VAGRTLPAKNNLALVGPPFGFIFGFWLRDFKRFPGPWPSNKRFKDASWIKPTKPPNVTTAVRPEVHTPVDAGNAVAMAGNLAFAIPSTLADLPPKACLLAAPGSFLDLEMLIGQEKIRSGR
jgi:hypothetical protein